MKKASLCFAGLVTLLFSPPAFALTPAETWTTRSSEAVQNLLPQDVPLKTTSHDSMVREFVNENQNQIQNHGENRPWMDHVPAPESVHPHSDILETTTPPTDQRQLPLHSLPPPLAPARPQLNEAAAPLATSSRPFGATPIQSQLGVEFGLSNSAQPLPMPEQVPVAPVQSVQANPPLQSGSVAPSNPVVEVQSPPVQKPLDQKPLDQKPPVQNSPEFTLKDLFAGDSDSMVAVTVGNAEGTRQPNGQPNKAFYGHTDPGNGVWNLGTFSFQHGAESPEAADVKQLNRLKRQAQVMQEKAADHGLKLTLEETLNGIDLANQAPQAVIDVQGYTDWLAKAHAQGLNGADAILWARVHSFIDPATQQWNAPGLGNTRERITHDQQRRMDAIASVLDAQDYAISPDARLRPQPIVFRIPGILGIVRQAASGAAQWFGL
jgi:hypothetical protein